ncbi:hypothetical protein [uncultured Lentibacter sp.]|uniref:hypothetical protein n=1 Tax=uncultured Lentibacter sp. TaxID=1659309 RepID=UPI0026051298|nr:hypothetical protein [uncultured Lentibacter sp.]
MRARPAPSRPGLTGLARLTGRGGLLPALVVLCLLAAPVLAQDSPRRLTPPEARSFALSLLHQGEPRAARALALGLLQKDSRDYTALMVLAEAESRLGRPAAAKFAARRAWRSTTVEQERFAAAFVMSSILKSEQKFGQAQLWLRRASAATDAPHYEAAARTAYRRVQAENPWSLSFNLSLAPSSNVNGGPKDNSYTIGGLLVDPTAVPLSGFEIGTMLSLTRRFKPGEVGRLSFGLRHDARRYLLSSAARRAVPTARGSDYAFSALDAHLRLDFASAQERARTSAEIGLNQVWHAGSSLATSQRLRLSRGFSRGRHAFASYGLTLQNQTRHDSALRSNTSYTLDGFALIQRPDTSLWRYGASLSKVQSAAAVIAHTAAQLSLSYHPATPLLKAKASFAADLQLRAYDRAIYYRLFNDTRKRRDHRLSLSANFVFEDIDYMGFSPSVTLNATRNISNITFFDSQEFGLSLGIKSTF